MDSALANSSIAILIANGFEENQITAVQRTLTTEKLPYKVIAPEQGLVNGWQNNGWGHYFSVDQQIGEAMGSDYDVLILIGGDNGVEKLRTNPHTRRIINHFLEAEKPIAAIGGGVKLLALSPKSAGLTLACRSEDAPELQAAQIEISSETQELDGPILTSNGEDIDSWIATLTDLVTTAKKTAEDAKEQDQQAA